jgi:hypothetical protein
MALVGFLSLLISDAYFSCPLLFAGFPGARGQVPSNDQCNAAKNVTIIPYSDRVNTTLATADPNGAVCPAIDNNDLGVWYSFRGNDKIVNLEISYTTASDPKIAVLTGSCDALNCVTSVTGKSLSWEGVLGTDYRILVSGSRADTIFSIKVRL